jgi:hypothetical protein
MDAYRIEDCIAQASVGMSRRDYLRIEDGRGIEVSIVYGAVTITQLNDPDDHCIGTGESFRIDRNGLTLVSAAKGSLCTLTPPAAQARALRVLMVAAGAAPMALFSTDARPKVGRFEAWLDKYWVPLFSSSARPTTAAL